MIELREVTKVLGERPILQGMSFQVPKGQSYVVMGPSGVGKSVTLQHIIGILHPDSGTVQVDGLEVPELDRASLMRLRRPSITARGSR